MAIFNIESKAMAVPYIRDRFNRLLIFMCQSFHYF